MGYLITIPEQITASWLTRVLRESGALPRGQVAAVTPDMGQTTFASTIWRLEIDYSRDACQDAPSRLFLKVSNPSLAPGEFDPQQLKKEIDFYQTIAPAMEAGISIPCYDAAYDPVSGAGHILLKEVSDTHTTCRDPDRGQNSERAVETLARLHAVWWDHPRLGVDIGHFTTPAERQLEVGESAKTTKAFIAACGDQLRPEWRAAYERVLAALPGLFQRHATGRNLTLVHGDAHPGNFLFPKDEDGETYLIDWQFWHPTIGGTDLAFLMAREWIPETRRRLELPLLKRYYKVLLENGVRGYSWEDCWDDYRLSVILVSIFIPVWQWGIFKWAPDFETLANSMAAFDELKCAELLAI